jgi:uncharacterized protein (DUF2336 family)
LRELIVSHEWAAKDRADAVVQDAFEWATIAASFEAPADSMPALVAQLMESGELTPAFLIRSVASGQVHLFEAGLAALAKSPPERVRSLIASGRIGNLRALLRKAGLPPRTYPAFVAAIDVIRSGSLLTGSSSDYRRATQLIDAIMEQYRKQPHRELDQILALLRRFATYAKRSAAREFAQQVREAA